jgi:ribosomal-protein-alanine N-acetyltransferase
MELKTKRLKLREIGPNDLQEVMEIYNNLNVARHLYLCPYPLKQEEALRFIAQCDAQTKRQPRGDYNLGIEFNQRVVGLAQLLYIDQFQGTATLGFSLGEPYWRQGITTEAVKEVIRFAFQEQNLRRIDSEANVENEGSNRILGKLGFYLEGERKRYRRMKNP